MCVALLRCHNAVKSATPFSSVMRGNFLGVQLSTLTSNLSGIVPLGCLQPTSMRADALNAPETLALPFRM